MYCTLYIYMFIMKILHTVGSYTPFLLITLHEYLSARILLVALWLGAISGAVYSGNVMLRYISYNNNMLKYLIRFV